MNEVIHLFFCENLMRTFLKASVIFLEGDCDEQKLKKEHIFSATTFRIMTLRLTTHGIILKTHHLAQ